MAILSGAAILQSVQGGSIQIEPFSEKQLGANSYDVRLAGTLLAITEEVLDFKKPYKTERIDIPPEGLILFPNWLYLGVTVERTFTPSHVPFYEGRSTVGRYFLQSHQTAGFGDLGYDGHWTLELTVRRATRVYANMRIGQIGFQTVEGEVRTRYGGRYCNPYDGRPVPRAGVPNNI